MNARHIFDPFGPKSGPTSAPSPLVTDEAVAWIGRQQTAQDLNGHRPADETTNEGPTTVRKAFPRIDWADLFNSPDVTEEWILEPIIPARRLVALYSPPKVGKSLLLLEIAVHVAKGTSVLGRPADQNKPRRVLYVDFENDPRGDILTRLRAMGFGPGDLENLDYLTFPTMSDLDTAQGGRELLACVEEYGSELVIIDTVSRTVAGEENSNDTWRRWYKYTGLPLKQAGVACVRLDHTGKDEDKGMRGGSAKSGDVDLVWSFSRATDTTFRLKCTDQRMRIVEDELTVHREMLPYLHHRVDPAGRKAAWDAKVADLVNRLDLLDADPKAGRDAVRPLLKKRWSELRVENSVLSAALKARRQAKGLAPE